MRSKIETRNRFNKGFTLIELLVVISIIGILATIIISSLNTARQKAGIAKTTLEIKSLRNAISLLESDTGKWPNGCPIDQVSNPEVNLTNANAGLLSAPTVFSQNGCTWTAGDISLWKGPYASFATDKWGSSYIFDPDYHICEAGQDNSYPVIVSYGPNTIQNYPTSNSGGGNCSDVSTDDIYIKLIN